MTYLGLVQKAIRHSGAHVDEPSTISGAENEVLFMSELINDAWKDIQKENPDWFFRANHDLTSTLSSGEDSLNVVDDFGETGDFKKLSVKATPVSGSADDEYVMHYVKWEDWKNIYDLGEKEEGQPIYITTAPNGNMEFYPKADKDYIIRITGSSAISELEEDADVPANLEDYYHEAIMWRAVMYWAMYHQDGATMEYAKVRLRPYHKAMKNKELPEVVLKTDALYRNYY